MQMHLSSLAAVVETVAVSFLKFQQPERAVGTKCDVTGEGHLLFRQVTYLQVIENTHAIHCAQDSFRHICEMPYFQVLRF